jgi:alkyl sulfatase BDS1-like metallo-beta-lactamase superfamily hydrolase
VNINQDDVKFFTGRLPPKTFANESCHLIHSFGNIGIIETHEGLVVCDVALRQFAYSNFKTFRKITDKPIRYLIYTHGHFDHAYGFGPFIKEIKKKGWKMPQVIAHENCVKRFEKYRMLDKYHAWLNAQQFASMLGDRQQAPITSLETLNPTIIMKGNDATFNFELGGIKFELYHDKGETDDSIWLWIPDKKLICTGDLMISSYPNVGNPYKVQRYPHDWALAMERMMEKDAEYLLPGHGRLIEGKENVREVLSITAEAMHFVHDEVVKRMNEGKWFEQIYHEMLEIFPDKFKNHYILQPIYGCYQFAIHAAYRLYHGWYNTGNPTDLFPAKSEDIASEFLSIIDLTKYMEHAKKLFQEGKFQLALHLLDVVIKAKNKVSKQILLDALKLKHEILIQKIKNETSFIAKNVLNNGAYQIKTQIKNLEKDMK